MNSIQTATQSKRTFNQIYMLTQAICKEVVAFNAVDVDAEARFPNEAYDAFKEAKLLSTYVPCELGGDGLTMVQLGKICELMGRYCASTAMIYAMHQIQVACLAHHYTGSVYCENYLKELIENQYLLASATTEIGVGGDVGSSKCAVEIDGNGFVLNKMAPVISYAVAADAILVTCRANPDAPDSDQSLVIVNKSDCTLEEIAGWDTLGFRGTCSSGFSLKSKGHVEQIMPTPYADILAKTMHPVAHLLWGSLWTGIASSAVNKARKSVRNAMRKNPNLPAVSSMRLTEVDEQLFSMKGSVYSVMDEYQALLDAGDDNAFSNFGFAVRTNNVKLCCSEMIVEIVGKALQIVGIMGYKNDTEQSLGRHIRDAYGAALMVNNDRIRGHNATMQVAMRD